MHEPTIRCNDVHCYSCMEDETGPAYIVCGECGHRYRTARELRKAYRRMLWRVGRRSQFLDKMPLRQILVLWVKTRAKTVWTCQHCGHDF